MRTPEATDTLGQLRAEWRRLGRSSSSRRALEALRNDAGDLVPVWVADLGALVEALEPRGGLDRLTRARLVAVLLAHADDPLVRRCLLQTMLPGIVSVARKLRFGEGIADDPRTFLADAISEAAHLLAAWAGERRPYAAPDMLSALRCRLRRRMLADKARRAELTAPPDHPADDDDHGPGTLAHRLALAATCRGTDAGLLYARCVLGVSSAELAAALGISGASIRRRLVTAAAPFLT